MPGPGRPKGSVGGRARALQILDAILAEEENAALLRTALQANFRQNPVRFFRQIVMPLLPKDLTVKMGEEGPIQWVSLLSAYPREDERPRASSNDT